MKRKSLLSLKNKLIYTVALCAINNISLISGSEATILDLDDYSHRHTNAANRSIVQELDDLADQFFKESSALETERLDRERTQKEKEEVDRKSDIPNQDRACEIFQDYAQACKIFQDYALACKAVSDEQIAEMSSLKITIEANYKAAEEGTKRREALKKIFLDKKEVLDKQRQEFDSISTSFTKELAKLVDIDSKRKKILARYISAWKSYNSIQFPEYLSGWTLKTDANLNIESIETALELTLRKDVLDVMRFNHENDTTTFGFSISPKLLMQIYRFFEAALTLRNDSNSKTLLKTKENASLFQYFLFKPHHNVIEFLKENNEIIEALIEFRLWTEGQNIDNDGDPLCYPYTEIVKINTRHKLIRDQLYRVFPNRIRDAKAIHTFNTLRKTALTGSPEFSIVFGELTSKAIIDYDILTDYNYLNNLEPELYQSLIEICQLIKDAVNDNVTTNSVIFRKVQDALHKNLFHDFSTYLRNHPDYMRQIPLPSFFEGLKNTRPSTRAELTRFLDNVARQYAPRGGAMEGGDFNRGQAMEIHDAANQSVNATIKGTPVKMSFNDAVIAITKAELKAICSYETTKQELNCIFRDLIRHSNRTNIFNQDVYNWVFGEINKGTDKENLSVVYSYLKTKYSQTELIGWLQAFMEESKTAYSGRANEKSCNKGVNERIVISLRRAIPDDDLLQEIFQQGEIPFMFKQKSSQLNNIDLWVNQLYDAGIRTTSTEREAQVKLKEAMANFFADVITDDVAEKINDGIENIAGDDVFLSGADHSPGLWKANYLPQLTLVEKIKPIQAHLANTTHFAQLLYDAGIRSDSNEEEAQGALRDLMNAYGKTVADSDTDATLKKGIESVVGEADFFDDKKTQGSWKAKFIPALLKLEHPTETEQGD